MKRVVEFSSDQGGSVLDEASAGSVTRGFGADRSSLVEKADRTFEDATATVTPAARSLIAQLRSIDDPPDEVGIVFGVQLSAQTAAFNRIRHRRSELHRVHDLGAPRCRRQLSRLLWKTSSPTKTSICL
jgi:Trypsin-co-occurring domain 1